MNQLFNNQVLSTFNKIKTAMLMALLFIFLFGSSAVHAAGEVYAWGDNSSGQAGNGSFGGWVDPSTVVLGLTNVVDIAAGQFGAYALKDDGTIWQWGSMLSSIPIKMQGISSVIAISAGQDHLLALRSDGTVWASGSGSFGQLGNGGNAYQPNTFSQVNLPASAMSIAAGEGHSLAALSDGSVWAWGRNHTGQLGNGNTTDQWSPVKVQSIIGTPVMVSAGGAQSFVLLSDNTIWAWCYVPRYSRHIVSTCLR